MSTSSFSCCQVGKSTVLLWFREYVENDDHFEPDGRGKHKRPSAVSYIVENNDHLLRLKRWIRANLEDLSLATVSQFINGVLLKDVTDVEYSTYINPLAWLEDETEANFAKRFVQFALFE